jgi:hypothetical protein
MFLAITFSICLQYLLWNQISRNSWTEIILFSFSFSFWAKKRSMKLYYAAFSPPARYVNNSIPTLSAVAAA